MLKSAAIGGSAGVISVIPSNSTGAEPQIDVEFIQGDEAGEIIDKITAQDELESLWDYLENNDQGVGFNSETTTVVRCTRNGTELEAIFTDISGSNADEAIATIGFDTTSESISVIGLEYITENENLTVENTTNLSDEIVLELPYKQKYVNVIDEVTNEIEREDLIDFLASQNSKFCAECELAIDTLCWVGCGLPFWILCGVLAIWDDSLPLSCVSFVSAACAFLTFYGCEKSGVNTTICSWMTLC